MEEGGEGWKVPGNVATGDTEAGEAGGEGSFQVQGVGFGQAWPIQGPQREPHGAGGLVLLIH